MQVYSQAIDRAISSRYFFNMQVDQYQDSVQQAVRDMPTEELPDDYFILLAWNGRHSIKAKDIPANLSHIGKRHFDHFRRRALGRESTILSLSRKGWNALKDRIRSHWDARDYADKGDMPWQDVELMADFYLDQVEVLTAKRLAKLVPAQVKS